MGELLYKICPVVEWQAALRAGTYKGSADDLRDGFIHLSRAHQLAGTAAKYFSGRTDLCLCAFDIEQLGPALRFEPSRGGELFPHLYDALPVTSVAWTEALIWDGAAHVCERAGLGTPTRAGDR